jgi:superfamily II DNA/RNA helicase
MTFSELGLSAEVLRAVEDAGYQTPTPIQEQAIPLVLQGRDVLGLAQTGTGKTASFTLPMIDILAQGRAKARMPRTLILEPTRELASQVADNFEIHGKYHKLSMALLIGGVSFGEQAKLIDRGVDVLIATPGRLLDHFERGKLMLHGVQVLVVDEADRMLDMGFIPDVERICSLLPPRRQTLFFSATMPGEIKSLVDRFLNNPERVAVAPPASPAALVEQRLAIIDGSEKREALCRLLRTDAVTNAIVFCNTKRAVGTLARTLERQGFNAAALHGDLDQHQRLQVLDSFRQGGVQILVASDVAARGLDIPKVSHVFNFDVPSHAEDYIHRIGRTGRAGNKGDSITLAAPEDIRYWDPIAKMLGRDVERLEIDGIAALDWSSDEGRRRRGRSNGRATAPAPKQRASAPAPAEAAPTVTAEAPAERAETPVVATPAKPRAERPAPVREAANAAPANATRANERSRQPREHRRGGRGRDHHHDDDAPIIGLGDHVPAFLLRPVVLRPSESEDTAQRAAG